MSDTAGGNDTGYDRQDPNVRFIAALGGVLIVVLIAAVFGVQYYHDLLYEQQVFVRVLEPESKELLDLRAREDEQLMTYRYLDREAGTVRIPIDRAIELLAKEAAAGELPYPTTPYAVAEEAPQ